MAVDQTASQAVLASKPELKDGMMAINLEDLEAETRCPVCLGVIKNARLVSGCMHRFCAECIEKWLRVCRENNCPQCRMPMQSRRDCKKDGKYDKLLRLLYNDIEKYETEIVYADDELLEEAKRKGAELRRAREAQKAGRKPTKADAARPAAAKSSPLSPHSMAYASHSGSEQQGILDPLPFQEVHVGQFREVSPITHADSAAEYLVAIGVYSTLPWAILRPELRSVHPPLQAPEVTASASHQPASAPASQQPASIPATQQQAVAPAPQQPASLPAVQPPAAAEQPCFKFVRPVNVDGQATTSGQPQVSQHPSVAQLKQAGQRHSLSRSPSPAESCQMPPLAAQLHTHSHMQSGTPSSVKFVSLATVQPQPDQHNVNLQRSLLGMGPVPVGSTTGIVGRGWQGYAQHATQPQTAPVGCAASGKGTKRSSSGAEGRGRKRQKASDREGSAEGSGRQSTGPIAAFLRPVPAAQPEAEAKSQAALLAAAAAAAGMAHSSLQAGAVQAAVQVCLTPAADDTGCRALPALQQPFLSCPINMTIQELCQLVIAQAGAQGMVALSRALTDPERNKSLQLLKPEQTLQGLLDGAGGLHQQLDLQYALQP